MNCRNVLHKLSAYIDGELTGAEMLSIRSHLSKCSDCSREERSFQRAFKRLLGSLPCVEPPSGLEERLIGALRTEQKASSWWPQLRIASLTAVAAAVVVMFVHRC